MWLKKKITAQLYSNRNNFIRRSSGPSRKFRFNRHHKYKRKFINGCNIIVDRFFLDMIRRINRSVNNSLSYNEVYWTFICTHDIKHSEIKTNNKISSIFSYCRWKNENVTKKNSQRMKTLYIHKKLVSGIQYKICCL